LDLFFLGSQNSQSYKENDKKLRDQIAAQEKQFSLLDAELQRVLSQNLQFQTSLFAKTQELEEANREIEELRQNL